MPVMQMSVISTLVREIMSSFRHKRVKVWQKICVLPQTLTLKERFDKISLIDMSTSNHKKYASKTVIWTCEYVHRTDCSTFNIHKHSKSLSVYTQCVLCTSPTYVEPEKKKNIPYIIASFLTNVHYNSLSFRRQHLLHGYPKKKVNL